MGKNFSISLMLNFTPNTLGCCGLMRVGSIPTPFEQTTRTNARYSLKASCRHRRLREEYKENETIEE